MEDECILIYENKITMEDEYPIIEENPNFLDNVPLKDMVKYRDYLVILPEKGSIPDFDVSGILIARFVFKNLVSEDDGLYVFVVMKVYSGEATVNHILTLKECTQKFDISDRSGFMVVETLEQYPKFEIEEIEESECETISNLTIAIAIIISVIITN